jgi:phosphatidylinositol kinase/protein kinase (PI-3  family)
VALRLAIAEARYHRALDKLQTHAQEQNSAQVRADEFRGIMRQEIASLVDEGRDGRPNLAALEYASSALRRMERLSRDVERERRLYDRYLREARAQRRKALRAWCAFNSEEKRNSRNELKSHDWVGT